MIIHLAQKFLENAKSPLIILLWLQPASHDYMNSVPIWLHCNDVIHSVHKKLPYKNCLYSNIPTLGLND